jgi:hypothetical protein
LERSIGNAGTLGKSPRDAAEHFSGQWKRGSWAGFAPTGNDAFDEYRRQKMDELEAMRRKLDEERKEFDDFLTKLRKAKDREDFERFVRERTETKTENI